MLKIAFSMVPRCYGSHNSALPCSEANAVSLRHRVKALAGTLSWQPSLSVSFVPCRMYIHLTNRGEGIITTQYYSPGKMNLVVDTSWCCRSNGAIILCAWRSATWSRGGGTGEILTVYTNLARNGSTSNISHLQPSPKEGYPWRCWLDQRLFITSLFRE